jgi:hypothetical protein
VKPVDSSALASLWHGFEAREEQLRAIIVERLDAAPAPVIEGPVVATYFMAVRSWSPEHAAKEISYQATSGTKDNPPGSLLDQ